MKRKTTSVEEKSPALRKVGTEEQNISGYMNMHKVGTVVMISLHAVTFQHRLTFNSACCHFCQRWKVTIYRLFDNWMLTFLCQCQKVVIEGTDHRYNRMKSQNPADFDSLSTDFSSESEKSMDSRLGFCPRQTSQSSIDLILWVVQCVGVWPEKGAWLWNSSACCWRSSVFLISVLLELMTCRLLTTTESLSLRFHLWVRLLTPHLSCSGPTEPKGPREFNQRCHYSSSCCRESEPKPRHPSQCVHQWIIRTVVSSWAALKKKDFSDFSVVVAQLCS